jgi:sporulation protein YlmC with PRC-barrel domain
MIHEAKQFEGYEISARDGVLGTVKDLYFDDQSWTLRYFVVATGTWLSGRQVLLSAPRLIAKPAGARTLAIDATQEQVRNSPSIDTDRPVSRQQEQAMHDHFGWPYYWGVAPFAGGGLSPMSTGMVVPIVPPTTGPKTQKASDMRTSTVESDQKEEEDPHLRSVREMRGYEIAANDGSIGQVEDFLVDDLNWEIRYLVIDTRKWLPGRKVLVAPAWIQSVRWINSEVVVDLLREQIKNGPEYDPMKPVTDDYTDRLYQHYGRTRARLR